MTVGSLTINLGMATQGVTAGAKKAQGEIASLMAGVQKLNGIMSMVGIGAGIGGLAATLYKVQSTLSSITDTARFADRLGIATGELQSLQYAARRSGVDAESFNMSLVKMTKNLGEAAVNGGPVAESLDRLGLKAKDLTGMSVDDALMTIADAMKNVHNEFERTQLTLKIFGRGAEGLGTMLGKGREGIEALGDAAKRMGLVLTPAQVDEAREYKKVMGDVAARFDGIWTSVSLGLAPWLESAAVVTMFWVDALKAAKIIVDEITFGLTGPGWKGWVDQQERASKLNKQKMGVGDTSEDKKLWQDAKAVVDSIRPALEVYQGKLEDLDELHRQGALSTGHYYAAMAKASDELDAATGGARQKLADVTDQIYAFKYGEEALEALQMKHLGASDIDIANWKMANQQLTEMKEALADATQAQLDMWDEIEKATEDAKTPLEKYADEIERLNELKATGLLSDNAYNAGIDKAVKGLEGTLPQARGGATGAYSLGSREEYSMRARINNQSPERTAKDILEQAKVQNARLLEIQRNTAEQVVNLVVL